MPALAVRTEDLVFSFTAHPIISGLSLHVPAGSAFGVLGPNGAGKSTLFRLLLGLLRPAAGKIWLLDHPLWPRRPAIYRNIGSLIEEPVLYNHLRGWENLQVWATYRRLPARRIQEVLHLVGLEKAAGERVQHYSTGMRQRLGIAIALLPDPDLLFLDEPTNGLDPEGIVRVRRLIQELSGDHGKTVILASHLLSEVEQCCTHAGMLHRGNLHWQGSLQELGERNAGPMILEVEVDDPIAARQAMQALPFALTGGTGSRLEIRLTNKAEISQVIDRLRSEQILIYRILPRERRLEDFFLDLFDKDENS